MKYITADLHFWHKGILNFCSATRPWYNVDSMNRSLVDIINSTVNPNDELYILGDVCFNTKKTMQLDLHELLSRINGKKHFVLGNHDHSNVREVLEQFGTVDQMIVMRHNKNRVTMCHYPMVAWENSDHGSVLFYGHMHGSLQIPGRAIDVGWDAHGKILKFDDAYDWAMAREIVKR